MNLLGENIGGKQLGELPEFPEFPKNLHRSFPLLDRMWNQQWTMKNQIKDRVKEFIHD